MKTFPAAFATEIAKKTGITPIWILKLTVGGTAYYLSDATHTIAGWNGGVTTKPWISSWGRVRESAGGGLREIRIADFSVTALVDPDASPNLETLVTSTDFEKSAAELYLWLAGLTVATDPPQLMLKGYVKDPVEISDELTVSLTIEDEATRLLQRQIGSLIERTTWPNADPDDVGKILPIVYGTLNKYPVPCTRAGYVGTLAGDLTSAATSATVSDAAGLAVNDILRCEAEEIKVTAIAGNALTIARAQNSTAAAAHVRGTHLLQKLSTPFIFVLADQEVTSVGDIFVRSGGVDHNINDQCTRYTGGAGGNSYAGYTGRAVATISQAQADVIRARVGHNHSTEPNYESTSIVNFDDYTNGSPGGSYVANVLDNDMSTSGLFHTGDVCTYYVRKGVALSAKAGRIRAAITCDTTDGYSARGRVTLTIGSTSQSVNAPSGGKQTVRTAWINSSDLVADLAALNVQLTAGNGAVGWGVNIYEAWLEVGAVTTIPGGLAENSLADMLIGGQVLGSVVATKTTPVDVVGDLLNDWAGISSTTQSGSLPGGYALNGCILAQRRLSEVLTEIAWQSRCYLRIVAGAGKLIVRPDALSSTRTIAACRLSNGIKTHSRKKSGCDEIINRVNLRYNRDWTQSGDNAYRDVSKDYDATSITDYGESEKPELFRCDWITSTTMADSVRAFYLARYKRRHWQHVFEVFLDHAMVEFSDAVTLGFAGSVIGEVVEAGFAPGDSSHIDVVNLVVEV